MTNSGKLRTLAGAGFIVAATFLAYLPALCAGFVFDDVLLQTLPALAAPDGLYRLWVRAESIDFEPVTYSVFWACRRCFGDAPAGCFAEAFPRNASAKRR
jgi:hypothetical protein